MHSFEPSRLRGSRSARIVLLSAAVSLAISGAAQAEDVAMADPPVAIVPGPADGKGTSPVAPAPFNEPERRRFYSSVGLGFDFSRGDYGESDATNSFAAPAFLKLEWEPVALRISIPFLLINGSERVLGTPDGPGATSSGTTVLGDSYRYGLGDVSTSLTYTYYPTRKWVPFVDLRLKVKAPTAEKDLGTQKVDTTLQFELTEQIGSFSVFGGYGYRFKGGARFDDISLASVGANYRVNDTMTAGLAFDWREASVSGVPDSKELSPMLSFKVNEQSRFSPYGVIGFSDASPDWGIGATTVWNF